MPAPMKGKCMFKQLIFTGLLTATALTGFVPATASAADQNRAERRSENDRGMQRPSMRVPPAYRNREARVDRPSRTQQQQQRQPVATQNNSNLKGRDWRRASVESRREVREERREDRGDWRDARKENQRDSREARRGDWREDKRDDRRDWRNDRRDDRKDWRNDRRDDRKDWRNDRRDDRREWSRGRDNDHRWDNNRRWDNSRSSWNRDWRRDNRYDWQQYRKRNRHIYRAPRYYAPSGWGYGYRSFSIGVNLWSGLYSDRYWISDPWHYRLPPAHGSLRWVRYYDDALLVDVRTGYVVDVIRDFFW